MGGAGIYTAMAARRYGSQVAMFSFRPDPCPENLKPVAEHLTEWLGLVISPGYLFNPTVVVWDFLFQIAFIDYIIIFLLMSTVAMQGGFLA